MAYQLRKTDQDVMIAEGAVVVREATLGKGCNIWYNAVIRGDQGAIVVGENSNIQEFALLHENVTIGKGCTIGHNAIIHGCTIGDNVLIGMGAIVLDGAKIADNCMVGAGALVTGKMDAPAGSVLLGSPAKVVRTLSEEDIEMIRESARNYLRLAEEYRKG